MEIPENTYDDIPNEEFQKRDIHQKDYIDGQLSINAFVLRRDCPIPGVNEDFLSFTRVRESSSPNDPYSLQKYCVNKIRKIKAYCLLKSDDIKNIKIDSISIRLLRVGADADNHSGVFVFDDNGKADASTTNPALLCLASELRNIGLEEFKLYTPDVICQAIKIKGQDQQ